MLLPAQVVPFLSHADPHVRRLARDYFDHCGDPAPVTADDVWAALDPTDDAAGGVAVALASVLAGLPQTDASVRRLIDALTAGVPEALDDYLQAAARAVDLPLLVRHRDLILGCDNLAPDVRDHLGRRLELADVSADAAWDQLMALGLASADKYASDIDDDALIEGAARHIDALAPRALALLADDEVIDWREVFAVKVVGLARHAPATPLLIGKLDPDADVLLDEAAVALARIGSDDVIGRMAAFNNGKPWEQRLTPGQVLGSIKRPPAEATLLALIAKEKHDEVREFLLNDLLDLCSLAGLDAARLLIAVDPRHPESMGLCERHLAAAVMHGVTLPEEAKWRERLDKHEAEVAARLAKMDAGDLRAFADRMRNLSPDFADPDPYPADDRLPPLPGEYDPYARIDPIRNAAPKVGRNDPCPCGSGKKHKKCCGVAK